MRPTAATKVRIAVTQSGRKSPEMKRFFLFFFEGCRRIHVNAHRIHDYDALADTNLHRFRRVFIQIPTVIVLVLALRLLLLELRLDG